MVRGNLGTSEISKAQEEPEVELKRFFNYQRMVSALSWCFIENLFASNAKPLRNDAKAREFRQ